VKGWSAVFVALAFGAAPAASPAQPSTPDLNSAARELARKTAALAGKGEAVAVAWRDISSLGSAGLAQARGAFESGLRDAGGRLSDAAPSAEAQITLSESQTEYLLVEEIRKGEERQVWIAGWSRSMAPVGGSGSGVLLETRLIWEQPERMLDVAVNGDAMLVLSGSSVTRFTRSSGQWLARASLPVTPAKPWPRDLRGRLRWNGTVQANLPGEACSGTDDGLQCRPSEEPWTLGAGAAPLLATFAAGRNYFDGRLVTPLGARKTVPPFYSAAAADDGGRPIWLLATIDSGTLLFDAALDPIGSAGAWGSDIAGSDVRCGGRSVVLATRPGDGRGPDAVRAYAVVNRAAVPLGSPAEFPGPVTALWPSGNGATAIVQNSATGLFQAYAVTVACGQ
jgi:hypothetical protein